MTWSLSPNPKFAGIKGPVVLAILDGVGEGLHDASDAVYLANTPFLDSLRGENNHGGRLSTTLHAHGSFVGLPSDGDMGNSEVGHNALGCGRIHDQGASLVGKAIASGRLFEGQSWQSIVARGTDGGTVHFLGLLSDGNVHSHIDHLKALIEKAATSGCKSIAVHVLLDGRDVPPTSAMQYIDDLEMLLSGLRDTGINARVASGGGRMTTTMDRYEADWAMVRRGWEAHVLGQADNRFSSLRDAVEGLRAQKPGIGDQDLPSFVIVDDKGEPVGTVQDGDAVVLFNFRGDRAMEICQAFDKVDFAAFDRKRRPAVFFAGMMEYDGDEHVPQNYLVAPPTIGETMGEYLARNQISQLAISETQKYGHVTYFWNGNRSGKFDDSTETYIEVPSDTTPFDERPWMKAAEITDRLIAELQTGKHRFARVNYANGDMVGHTGNLPATICAVQAVDLQLMRLAAAVKALDGVLIITADHGNADEMYQHDKKGGVLYDADGKTPLAKTSHTLNAVPMRIYDPNYSGAYRLEGNEGAGIANVMATCLELLGKKAPDDLQHSLLRYA